MADASDPRERALDALKALLESDVLEECERWDVRQAYERLTFVLGDGLEWCEECEDDAGW